MFSLSSWHRYSVICAHLPFYPLLCTIRSNCCHRVCIYHSPALWAYSKQHVTFVVFELYIKSNLLFTLIVIFLRFIHDVSCSHSLFLPLTSILLGVCITVCLYILQLMVVSSLFLLCTLLLWTLLNVSIGVRRYKQRLAWQATCFSLKKKKFYWNIATPNHLRIYGCFCVTKVGLGSYYRDYVVWRPRIFIASGPHRKRLPTLL